MNISQKVILFCFLNFIAIISLYEVYQLGIAISTKVITKFISKNEAKRFINSRSIHKREIFESVIEVLLSSNDAYLTSNDTILKTIARNCCLKIPEFEYLSLHCNSCAVVSSSGQLTGSKAGSEIDSSDCILRTNDSPVRGFEEDVGSRTTIRVVAPTGLGNVYNNHKRFFNAGIKEEHVIYWAQRQVLYKGHLLQKAIELGRRYRKVKFYAISKEQYKLSDYFFENGTGKNRRELWGGEPSKISTGFYVMVIALQACDNIQIYGMASPSYCRENVNSTSLYHYYGINETECDIYNKYEYARRGHRYITEKEVFLKWSKHRNITFHYPKWPTEK